MVNDHIKVGIIYIFKDRNVTCENTIYTYIYITVSHMVNDHIKVECSQQQLYPKSHTYTFNQSVKVINPFDSLDLFVRTMSVIVYINEDNCSFMYKC